MKQISFLFILGIMLFASCKKAKSGCTDLSAVNYDETAEIGVADCKYTGGVIFWIQDINTGAYGVDSLLVMVNDVVIGKLNTDSTFVAAPSCSATPVNFVKYSKDMGEVVSESFHYRITTKDSTNLKKAQMNLIRSQCQNVSIQ